MFLVCDYKIFQKMSSKEFDAVVEAWVSVLQPVVWLADLEPLFMYALQAKGTTHDTRLLTPVDIFHAYEALWEPLPDRRCNYCVLRTERLQTSQELPCPYHERRYQYGDTVPNLMPTGVHNGTPQFIELVQPAQRRPKHPQYLEAEQVRSNNV
jgi:hypothetical protein